MCIGSCTINHIDIRVFPIDNKNQILQNIRLDSEVWRGGGGGRKNIGWAMTYCFSLYGEIVFYFYLLLIIKSVLNYLHVEILKYFIVF